MDTKSIEEKATMPEAFEDALKESRYHVTDMLKEAGLYLFVKGSEFGYKAYREDVVRVIEENIKALDDFASTSSNDVSRQLYRYAMQQFENLKSLLTHLNLNS